MPIRPILEKKKLKLLKNIWMAMVVCVLSPTNMEFHQKKHLGSGIRLKIGFSLSSVRVKYPLSEYAEEIFREAEP